MKLLKGERRKLRAAVEVAQRQYEQARHVNTVYRRETTRFTSTLKEIGTISRLLSAALVDEAFNRDVHDAAMDQQAIENDVLGFLGKPTRCTNGGESSACRSRPPDPFKSQSDALLVRAKHHRDRSAEEKRWVALDAVVNPTLYHHVTRKEAEEMRWDALYYTHFEGEDISRILELPAQVQLALPFLHTPGEIEAHEILGRYTLGIKADHFLRQDRHSQDACLEDRPPDRLPSSLMVSAGNISNTRATASRNLEEEKWRMGKTSPRILAVMRNRAQVQLKTVAERDLEEAVWLALDRLLRPGFYSDEDEAEGDRDDDLHQEDDAREDTRNVCVTNSAQSTSDGGANMNGVSHFHADVLDCAEGDAGDGANERETLAAKAAKTFNQNDLECLVREGLGKTESIVVERGNGSAFPGSSGIGGPEARGQPWRAIARVSASTMLGDSSEGDGHTAWAESTTGEEAKDNESDRSLARLREIAQNALSRFVLHEEATPIGGQMVQSLAMFKEATLRLCRVQHKGVQDLKQDKAVISLPCEGTRQASIASQASHKAFTGSVERDVASTNTCISPAVMYEDTMRGSSGAASKVIAETSSDKVEEKQEEVSAPRFATKIFGSWEVTHPASLGVGSQEMTFRVTGSADVDTDRVHPASFRFGDIRNASGTCC